MGRKAASLTRGFISASVATEASATLQERDDRQQGSMGSGRETSDGRRQAGLAVNDQHPWCVASPNVPESSVGIKVDEEVPRRCLGDRRVVHERHGAHAGEDEVLARLQGRAALSFCSRHNRH